MELVHMERTLRVGKTVIDVYVGRNLHILDRDQEGTVPLNSAMSNEYLDSVLEWIGEVPFDRVFTYHTDGFIAEWREGYRIVPNNDRELYYDFVEKSKERKEQKRYVH